MEVVSLENHILFFFPFRDVQKSPGDRTWDVFTSRDSSLVNVLSNAGVSQALPPVVGRELCHPLVSSLFKQNISVMLSLFA